MSQLSRQENPPENGSAVFKDCREKCRSFLAELNLRTLPPFFLRRGATPLFFSLVADPANDAYHYSMENSFAMETVQNWVALNAGDIGVVEHPTMQHLRLWTLVLASQDISFHLKNDHPEWHLLVPEDRHADAISQIRAFEEENFNWPPSAPSPLPHNENLLATLSVLILLAAFYNITHSDVVVINGTLPDWLQLGMLQSGRVRDGEWWRLVTALTLHADLQHLLGNLAIGGIFVLLLCRQLGSGLAWTLLLGAGMLGNLINAFLQPVTHNSVGASTAVFGAVGVLAATSMVRYRHHLSRRWPLPVAAAFALLAVFGSEGKNTDLGAHLFGLLAGGVLGIGAELLMIRYGYPGCRLNLLFALFSVVLVVTAWCCALESISMVP